MQSDSLADGVLYFTWDEIFDAALTSMKELDADEEDTQAVQQALEQAKQQFVTALSTASSLSVSEAKTPEEGMAAVKEMFKDDPVMVSFVEDIYNRMKQTEGEFTSEAHDPATLKMELSITADDYVKICDSKYMRNILETAAEQELSLIHIYMQPLVKPAHALHIGIHTDLHACVAHIGHPAQQRYGVVKMGGSQKFQMVHRRRQYFAFRVTPGHHARNYVNPLHQHTAEQVKARVDIHRHDDMHLLGPACRYGLDLSLIHI